MSTNTDAITDAVVSSEPPINNNIAVSNGVTNVVGADSKTETLVDDSRVSGGEIGVVMDKDVKVGGDIVVQDEIIDVRVSVDEIGIVNVMEDDKSEVVLDESISGAVVSSGPLSDSVGAVEGVKVGDEVVGLEAETLTVKPQSDDCNGDGDIVVRGAVDGSRVSGGEIGVVVDKDVKVGGDIVVQDEIIDARVSVDEIGIVNVMEDDKSEVVLDESISSAVVSSGPLSDSVGAVEGVKVGDEVVGLETETLTVKPSDDCNGDGDIVVRGVVDGSRVSGDEKGIVMDTSEVVLDESISDDVASSEPLSKRDVDAIDRVKIGSDSLGSETEVLTVKRSDGNSGDGDIVVQGSVDDCKASRDEKGVVTNDNEVVLDKSVSDDVASSEPQSNKDVDAVEGVKIGADSLGLKTETLTMKPSADHVQDSVDDSRASKDKQEIVTESIEKVSDENEVNNEEKEGEYKVTDIVWAKVKNYPWWPGQIFDPSAATDKAKKFSNKKGLLVGYFGDQSFAWNKPPNIKPFRKNFGKLEKQSNSKPFLHAVNCALDEVSRRVDFGLACSCLSKEVYDKVKSQVFVNAGIKEEASKIDGGDRFSTVSTFKPVKTVQFVQELAREHFDGVSRLEALSVRTQLLAFFRWKGRNQLKAPNIFDELDIKLEDESELPLTEENKVVEDEKLASLGKKESSKKRKLDVSDSDSDDSVPPKKERSLTKVTTKGKSSAKKTKKKKPDVSDSDSDSDDLVPLKKKRSLKNVAPKGNSSAIKTSSKKRKPDVSDSDSDDSVPLKKERSLKNATPKGTSSVKKTSSKKRKPDVSDSDSDSDGDSDDSFPLKKERSLKNVTPKGKLSAKKTSSEKKKPDVSDSDGDSDSDDSIPLKKERSLKNVTPKGNSSAKKTSSKKRKPDVSDSDNSDSDSDSDSDDSIPLKKERSLKNATPKGNSSAKKTSSKKRKPDVSDSDRDSDDSVPLEKERSLTNVTPKGNSSAKRTKQGISKKATIEDNVEPDSVGKKVSSTKRKADVCDSDDSYSVPRKKEKSSTKMTSKGSSSVKRSKNNTSKKTTLKDNVDKEENGNGTDNKRPSISSPRMFRVGNSICRIAKQLSESPSILKKESEKSKNDEKTAKKDGQPVDASQTEE
ncbi:putative non-specific serine/threonine protein kinase [Helianthus debilis subsp. tardiflorus]